MTTYSTVSREPAGVEATFLPAHAARMTESAVLACCQKSVRGTEGAVVAALQAADPGTHDCFRYHLSQQVAEYLRKLDDNLTGVYSFSYGDAEDEGEERSSSPTQPLSLILRVRRKTAALNAAVAALDQALLEEYRKLMAPVADRMNLVLDAHLVDDEEAEQRTGMAVVLKSAFTPPTPIWTGRTR